MSTPKKIVIAMIWMVFGLAITNRVIDWQYERTLHPNATGVRISQDFQTSREVQVQFVRHSVMRNDEDLSAISMHTWKRLVYKSVNP